VVPSAAPNVLWSQLVRSEGKANVAVPLTGEKPSGRTTHPFQIAACIIGAVVETQDVVVGIDARLGVALLGPIISSAIEIDGLVKAQESRRRLCETWPDPVFVRAAACIADATLVAMIPVAIAERAIPHPVEETRSVIAPARVPARVAHGEPDG